MKTAERAHSPSELWEAVKLHANYDEALAQIDEQLLYWSPFQIHKCKQRLTKLRQMLIQSRRLRLHAQEEVVAVKRKAIKRDRIREEKAVVAARLEHKIEEELLMRLQTGVYKDIYDYNLNQLYVQSRNREKKAEKKYIPEIEEEPIANEEYLF